MVHLEGTKEFSLPRHELWAKLTDLNFLVDCVPDVSQVREVKKDSASLVLRPGFSFIRGTMDLEIGKLEEVPGEMAKLRMKTKGIGQNSEVESAFNLEDKDAGTLVRWSVDVQHLGGLLKAVPHGLIHAGAQKVVTDLLAGIERKLVE